MFFYSPPRQIRLPATFTLPWRKRWKTLIIFQNGHNKARSPGRLGKNTVEGKEGEKGMGDEKKQDNAP
jgi:hypothetical protein